MVVPSPSQAERVRGPMSVLHRSSRLLPTLLGLACCGCAFRQPVSAVPDQLPLPLMAPGAVVVEIVFVSIDPAAEALERQLWQQADEQIVPTASRRQLTAHGLRCGLVGARPPDALVALYQRSRQSMDVPAGSAVVPFENLVHRQRRMQLRHGQRREIVMPGDPVAELQLELHEQPPRQLRLTQARGLLSIQLFGTRRIGPRGIDTGDPARIFTAPLAGRSRAGTLAMAQRTRERDFA